MYTFNQIIIIIFSALTSGFLSIAIIRSTEKYSRKSGNYLPMIVINTIEYYIFALFIVILSATIGPFVIDHLPYYEIDKPYSMTGSEATYYTLQALIAVVIGSYLAQKNNSQR